MTTAISTHSRPSIGQRLSSPGIWHGLFWGIVLLVLILLEGNRYGFLFTLSNELINTALYALIVYFNLFYLIPNYLSKKHFLTYLILLILASFILTPLKVLIFYIKFQGKAEAQTQLLLNQFWYFASSLTVSGISTLVKITTDWYTQLKEKQELETQTMQSELKFLKSQINPHFLFNTLNSLYALTLKKSDQAPEIVLKLSEMMRYMLYECNEKKVLLSKEISYLQNYIDLERIRQGRNAEIQLHVEGDPGDFSIAPLLFIPFLENSFKHGLGTAVRQDGFVQMEMKIQDNLLTFQIENSKSQRLPTSNPGRPSGGIGLVNVQRRLNLLYPQRFDLKLEDSPHIYKVTLSIELDYEADHSQLND